MCSDARQKAADAIKSGLHGFGDLFAIQARSTEQRTCLKQHEAPQAQELKQLVHGKGRAHRRQPVGSEANSRPAFRESANPSKVENLRLGR